MTAGWVAASVRGRALVRSLVGRQGAADLAARDWPDARHGLSTTMYGTELPANATRNAARAVAMASTAWQLRVLAGWLPPGQSALARLFAAPLEIANIESHLAFLAREEAGQPVPLGSLAVAWPRVARTTSADQLRTTLTRSVWGDPGGTERASVALGLRLALARRVAARLPSTADWSRGGAAVLVARERFGFHRDLNEIASRVADEMLGRRWREVPDLRSFRSRLPRSASWAFEGVDSPDDLWLAEVAVARRVAGDSSRLLKTRTGHDRAELAAVMALLLIDLRYVLAAIDLAGLGPSSVGAFDAVA